MAGRALAVIGPLGKLAIVWIGLVTIHAPGKKQSLLEVAVGVALGAVHAEMLSFQRILRLRVVKALIHRGERNLLPARGAVAGLATLGETAMMRILVAIRALVEWDSCISRFVVRARAMALGAFNLVVQSGQGIACHGVIELSDANHFPVFDIVTLLAGLPEPSVVRILVAGSAVCRQAQIRAAQVFDFDCSSLLRGNSRWRVASIASKARVLALKRVARLLVFKRFYVPLDKWEIFAIVFRVAARALLAGARRNVVSRMQSLAGAEPRGDFGVAVQALERRLSTELVASGAVG